MDTSRKETVHIDETTRTARHTVQWFLEAKDGASTPRITHNNKLTFFICGEKAFADIALHIRNAKQSIDLCCWGFDPGMELERGKGKDLWPRGPTFGDLLIDAGKRGVKVRLLVWYSKRAANDFINQHNMPGHTHDKETWRGWIWDLGKETISACKSWQMLHDHYRGKGNPATVSEHSRIEYCSTWYKLAFDGLLEGITVLKRKGDSDSIDRCLASEEIQPVGLSSGEGERAAMVHGGTHHQKPILIDFAYESGTKSVGYIMGLNSVTDYWDTADHKVEDFRRERGGRTELEESVQEKPEDPGFTTRKPYHDYACRLDGGKALLSLHDNFECAWARAGKKAAPKPTDPPIALLRKARAGDSSVQVVRTQPEENDKSIKAAYFQATKTAAHFANYIYLENQYFQYEPWSKHLLKERKAAMEAYELCRKDVGKPMEEMPILHIFLVVPVPENEAMVPRTYDALAVLGEQQHLNGQQAYIDRENKVAAENKALAGALYAKEGFGPPRKDHRLSDVVVHANSITKLSAAQLVTQYRLKVSTAMLNVSNVDRGRWRYREIYIHSKLMIVDDSFLTLGSANLNQRSMSVDSEINLTTDDPQHALQMRIEIWNLLSGGAVRSGPPTQEFFGEAFAAWVDRMDINWDMKQLGSPLKGFILPLRDKRSSTSRLG